MRIAAVIFDLDGVLLDSETIWNTARREITLEHGGQWRDEAPRVMMGMSAAEWSAYMHEQLGVAMSPEQISDVVVSRLEALYREHVPLIDGARDAVLRAAEQWPLGLASSSNRPLIDLVLELSGLDASFAATVSSDEVAHGKPAPDVYLEAAGRLGVQPRECAAVEDSTNGLRSAAAAGMLVLAIPNREFPPAPEALGLAAATLPSIVALTPELIRRAAGTTAAADPR